MHMKSSTRWLASGFALLVVLGCKRAEQDSPKASDTTPTVEALQADNTKKNERDRDSNTLTPGDQGESQTDRNITQEVRRNIVGNDSLSMTAKNVKIITLNNVVTLRGPVHSPEERAEIARIAQGTSGVREVDNQLEVAQP